MTTDITGILVIIVVTIAFTKIIQRIWRPKRPPSPPGPFNYPIFGFLIHMFIGGESYQKKLISIKEKYGSVSTVKMGSFNCVWLNDYQTVKEAFSNPVFCGRPRISGITSRTEGNVGGIIFNDGCDYKEQSRFVIRQLKELGIRKRDLMEDIIEEEALELIKNIESWNGKLIDTRHLFNLPIMNVLWRLITNEKFQHDDPTMIQLTEVLIRNMELQGAAKATVFLPWLNNMPYWIKKWFGLNKYTEDAQFIFNFWKDYVQKKANQFRTSSKSPVSFLEHYIIAIDECTDENSGFYGDRGIVSLSTTIQDLFIAGSETTSTTLRWIFLYLGKYPHVQEKILKEIDDVVGSNTVSILKFRSRMKYLEAFLDEVMRHRTLAPLGIMHRTIEETMLHGYFIPKNTIVLSNVCAIHNDPEYWQSPDEFIPERFLENFQISNRREGFLPFSIGGRQCLGETLARDELFLIVVKILSKFTVDPNPQLSIIPIVGVGSIPSCHKLKFLNRH